MAQVHAATLFGGEDVVVKVQRPGIAAQVRGDASILVVLARLLELVVLEASAYRATDLVLEFQSGLNMELDFSLEAKNLLAFSNFNHARAGVHVPQLYPEMSGRTVLTMERIRGKRISDLKGDPERASAIIERLVEVAFDHVFLDGLFHGDPHPGNLLVTDVGDIAFIDFGLIGRVARDAQDKMLMVLLALSLKDSDTLCRVLLRLGVVEGRVELHAFRAAIARLLDRYLGLTVAEVSAASVLSDLVELSMRFGIRLPREFALLSKASVSIEGIVRTLHPGFDPSRTLSSRAEDLLLDRMDPRRLKGGGLRTALQIGMLFEELPLQVGQALMDLERGNLQVAIRNHGLDTLERSLRSLGMTIFSGMLAAALALGGIYTLSRDVALASAPVVTAVAFAIAGLLTGGVFTWYFTGGKLPKINLQRILPRMLPKDGPAALPRRGPPR
jgi:ubiquinone biosynthesis protein